MKRIISSSEIVGPSESNGQACEVCATAEGDYDETRSELVAELDSFLRPVDLLAKERHFSAPWLPRKQTIRESVSREEAPELARELFRRWVGRVRQSIPALLPK
jgi:hypothetical protein